MDRIAESHPGVIREQPDLLAREPAGACLLLVVIPDVGLPSDRVDVEGVVAGLNGIGAGGPALILATISRNKA